jgi:hypothetical protein
LFPKWAYREKADKASRLLEISWEPNRREPWPLSKLVCKRWKSSPPHHLSHWVPTEEFYGYVRCRYAEENPVVRPERDIESTLGWTPVTCDRVATDSFEGKK